MTQVDLDRDDPTFPEDLEISKEAVDKAARWMADKGYPVQINPTFLRPTAEERHDFSDNGDLHLLQRVEVKRRNIEFTGKDDFPYPTVIVDSAHRIENADPKPFLYIIFNKSLTVGFLIYVKKTMEHWTEREFFNTHINREQRVFECPLEHVELIRL